MEEFQNNVLPLMDKIYRFAYRLTFNERDAEDLVQDTLLRAFDKFEQFEPGTSLSAWLLAIARSIFINKYRKKKREGKVISIEDMPAGEASAAESPYQTLPESPEDFLFRNVFDAELRDALKSLPHYYLEVIVLVDLEELSYREVGEMLNIPPGTVMSRLHRGRKALQGQLQELAKRKGIIKTNVTSLQKRDGKDGRTVRHAT